MHIETKRFLYKILINTVCRKSGCNAVIGARKVGKTILFLQLNEYFNGEADYFDCTSLLTDESFDFKDYYEKAISDGKKIIFLDEVCKINDYYLADFIKCTKIYSSQLCIMITGSVATVVKKRMNEIGRGSSYQLPPFMYIEKLCWEHGCNEVDVNAIKNVTSDVEFKKYLKHQMMTPLELLGYMQGVVDDTITSYRERTFLESSSDIEDNKLMNSLKYISLCQYVYKKDNGQFVNIPSIEKEIRDQIFEDYKIARAKWNLSNIDIENTVNILLGCNLAKKVSAKRTEFLNVSGMELADDKVPEIVFEYPWYCSVCFDAEIQNSEAMLNLWIEYAVLLRASYVYQYVNKYRSNDDIEIDVIYLAKHYSGVEVKDRPYKNNSHAYINRERTAADNIGLCSFIISSSDEMYRNDKIISCLELEYIDLMSHSAVYSDKTIEELFKKYDF